MSWVLFLFVFALTTYLTLRYIMSSKKLNRLQKESDTHTKLEVQPNQQVKHLVLEHYIRLLLKENCFCK